MSPKKDQFSNDELQVLLTRLKAQCFSGQSPVHIDLLLAYVLELDERAPELIKGCLHDSPSTEEQERLQALVDLFKKYLKVEDQKVKVRADKTDDRLYDEFKQLLGKWGKDIAELDEAYRKRMSPSVNKKLGKGISLTGAEWLHDSDIDSALGQLFQFTSDKVEERYLPTDRKNYYIAMATTFEEVNLKAVAESVQKKVDNSRKQPYEIFIPCLKDGHHWVLVKLVVDPKTNEKSINYCNSTNSSLTESEESTLTSALSTKTIKQEQYAPVQAADSWSCGYHVVRMVAQNLASHADNTKKLEELVSADNTAAIRDRVVSVLPNAPKGSPSPSPESEAAKKQREALQHAMDYLKKNKQTTQQMRNLQKYTVPADKQFDALRLHAALPDLQKKQVFQKLTVYDNGRVATEWDPTNPDEALNGKTVSKYEFSCDDGKSISSETITITYDVDQHEFVVAATEEESLLTSFIKMAQLAKESGHQDMKISELSEDSPERSYAWIAIKLVGLAPWPAEEPRPSDQDRYEELHKELFGHIPSVRLEDPAGSSAGGPGPCPRGKRL